jgi:hypothetical protein
MSTEDPRYGPPRPAGPVDGPAAQRNLVLIFVGLGVLGLLIGIGAAKLTDGGGDPGTASLSPAQTTTPSATDTPTTPATGSTSPSAGPSPTPPPNYTPIGENAPTEKDLDFGFLTKVSDQGGVIAFRFDRAYFYTGEDAKKHNKGVAPPDDYLIVNDNPTLRSFVLAPTASIVAVDALRNQPGAVGREALTAAQFVANGQRALGADPGPVPVWLRHTNGLSGPVTALAEQYLP